MPVPPLLAQNVDLGTPLKLSPWRKVAMGTWRDCGDPSVYAFVDIDVKEAEAYLDRVRRETGARATLSHFFGRVIAGDEVLARLARTQDDQGRPVPGIDPDRIVKAEVLRKRDHKYEPALLPDPKKP